MRQQTDSNSQSQATDSQITKKERIQKNRMIRKEKNQTHPQREETNGVLKLTREEKARLQKEKNREAAQKSRDNHREYVNSLQKQISQLKQELKSSRKLCYRCRHSLDQNQYPEYSHPISSESSTEQIKICKHQHNIIDQLPVSQIEQQDQDFLRVLEPHDDSHMLKWLLFVCMITVAVFIINGQSGSLPAERNLLQTYTAPFTPSMEQTTTSFSLRDFNTQTDQISPISHGLVHLNHEINNQMCLDSLMNTDAPLLKRSLTTLQEATFNDQQGVLLCSYKNPKPLRIKQQLSNSPIVKIFLLGSQIKEMLTSSNPLVSLMDKNIQLNGIYRLFAEIKKVDLVNHHNCLI